MSETTPRSREGSLEAPTRHPLNWRDASFYDETALFDELERVFDICHGCRRCFSLCNSFPTLFDAVDESDTGEVDGVARKVYWEVVDHCYLCDMCYMSKCPYVPPHEFNIDFPHLMLRAKAKRFRDQGASMRDKILTSTDTVGKLAGIPVVAQTVNAVNHSKTGKKILDSVLGVHPDAPVPDYQPKSLARRMKNHRPAAVEPVAAGPTRGKVALFGTCYGRHIHPDLGEDLVAVFEHNGIPVTLLSRERCCGMPKLELGDLEQVARLKEENIPELASLVDDGWDIVAPIPSCVLMFKQELPLMFPGDPAVSKVQQAVYDPFEYLMLRHRDGKLRTDFARSLGNISYHVACHLRVQNIGLKTRDVLQLIPETKVDPIERCSGHNGTYAVKREFHETSMKIGRPVFRKVKEATADFYASDCPMAGDQIAAGAEQAQPPTHPLRLLRIAYGI
jgi:Fe-S oxidoreductase